MENNKKFSIQKGVRKIEVEKDTTFYNSIPKNEFYISISYENTDSQVKQMDVALDEDEFYDFVQMLKIMTEE